jgi:hypothetical protein
MQRTRRAILQGASALGVTRQGRPRKELRDFHTRNGGEIVGLPPRDFSAYVASEIERYRKVLLPLGIQID